MVSVRQQRAGEHTSDSEEILEEGHVYFAYRPRIGQEEPQALEDLQRFYMVLEPEGARRFRLAVLGRKRLPSIEEHERIWGFIDSVESTGDAVEEELQEQRYGTKTRGGRTVPSARPAGEGIYALIKRGRNLHLVYELELPKDLGDVQEELNIERQGSYVLSIKNPQAGSPPGAGLSEKEEAVYPKAMEEEFRGRRFASEDPRLLDYEGTQFVLIGARAEPEDAYGVDIETGEEDAREAEIFRHLKMSASKHPIEPITKGKWR